MKLTVTQTPLEALPTLGPDHTAQLGADGAGADHTVTTSAAAHSDPAPREGVAVIFIPSGLTVRARIGADAVATATDQAYAGPTTLHWPIREGERVSLFGDGGGGLCTICMAR